jgi:hypothetical protein
MRRGLVASLLILAACSSSSGGSSSSFASQMCAKLSGCSSEPANCQAAYEAAVFDSSCQSTLLSASCADLVATPVPPSLLGCFPACSGGTMSCGGNVTSTTCNSDGTFTQCNQGNQYVYTCTGICASESKSYSGTCGTTYLDQMSPTGCAECWCQ